MIKGQIYGKIVSARNLTALTKEASRVANLYINTVDELLVQYNNSRTTRLIRKNNVLANGEVRRGKWE